MSKFKRNDAPDAVFHLTGRVNWQKWHLMHAHGCELFWQLVVTQAKRMGVQVFGGVIMSNHFHLVAQSPPEAKYRRLTSYRDKSRHLLPFPPGHCKSTAMGQFMREVRRTVSRRIQSRMGVTGRLWERRYHARRLEDVWDMIVAIAYDHRNPVRAGVVTSPEKFEWSTASWWTDANSWRRCRPPFERLPFSAKVDPFREQLARYEQSKLFDLAVLELARDGILWHTAEGRAALAAIGFGPDQVAREIPHTASITPSTN